MEKQNDESRNGRENSPPTINPVTGLPLRTPAQDRLKRLQAKLLNERAEKEKLAKSHKTTQNNCSNETSKDFNEENTSREERPSTSAEAMRVTVESASKKPTSNKTVQTSKTKKVAEEFETEQTSCNNDEIATNIEKGQIRPTASNEERPSTSAEATRNKAILVSKAPNSNEGGLKSPTKRKARKRPAPNELVLGAPSSKLTKTHFQQNIKNFTEDDTNSKVGVCTTKQLQNKLKKEQTEKKEQLAQCYETELSSSSNDEISTDIERRPTRSNEERPSTSADATREKENSAPKEPISKESVQTSSPKKKAQKRPAPNDLVIAVPSSKSAKIAEDGNKMKAIIPTTETIQAHGSEESRLESLKIPPNDEAATDSTLLNKDTATKQRDQDPTIFKQTVEEVKITDIANRKSYAADQQKDELVNEYYEAVNQNLLRFAEERKQNENEPKLLQDHYYIVLDTNMLLRNLTFVEDLSVKKLCNTKGTVLYIPYCVLQELDKLKLTAIGDCAKLQVRQAIKYLNSKLESKDKHIQAQSAVNEMEHIIDVVSAHDRIINCCLQIKRKVNNVMLITEDLSLKNKAISNIISVSTKSELISKHF